jgi:hypothetical protein
MAAFKLSPAPPTAVLRTATTTGSQVGGVSEAELRDLPKARQPSPGERLDVFLNALEQMSEVERVRAARVGAFTHWERSVWAARFPEQVPLVNGEFEWIALSLADLD